MAQPNSNGPMGVESTGPSAAQQHHVRERQAEIEHARNGQRCRLERHAPMQQHAHEQHQEHAGRRDGHRLLGTAKPRAAPEQHEEDEAEHERQTMAEMRERAHVLEPREERQHERERREQRPARLDDKGGQRDADDACDDSCKQRFLLIFPMDQARRTGACGARNRRARRRTPPA